MHEDRNITLTESQLRELVSEGVEEALTRMGMDAKNPLEMQKDFQHLREFRQATHAIQKRGLLVIVSILVSGICAAAWLGFKGMINGN